MIALESGERDFGSLPTSAIDSFSSNGDFVDAAEETDEGKRTEMYIRMQQLMDEAKCAFWVAWPTIYFATRRASSRPSIRMRSSRPGGSHRPRRRLSAPPSGRLGFARASVCNDRSMRRSQ